MSDTRLAAGLQQIAAASAAKFPERVQAMMARSAAGLAASGIAEAALKVGATAPAFTLPDQDGAAQSLAGLLAQGPVVLAFYRGGWCPYCNLALRALAAALPMLRAHGATLVAVSPELPDHSIETARTNALGFPVLSDTGNAVARRYGLEFELDRDLAAVYASFGIDLPTRNGSERWLLPLPATFVIDRDGIVHYAFVDTDYRRRAEPADVVAALAGN